jgi:hypothetical protein
VDVNKHRLCNMAFRHLGAFMRWSYALNAVIQKRLTKRALDAGDSARFTSIFLASSFSCSQAKSTPAPAPVTQTVGPRKEPPKGGFEIVGGRNSNHFC